MLTRYTLLSAALALTTAGCWGNSGDRISELAEQVATRDQQIIDLQQKLGTAQELAADRLAQITQLQALGPKRLEKVFHVERIHLASYTGGYDSDNVHGDEGVNVYLEPVDAAGSVLKAAGDVTIQLYDLAAPAGKNLIGEYRFGVDEIGKYWYSGALTYYFRFECPWLAGPPAHGEVTIRVVFVDYLTGRKHLAQTHCAVKLPVATQPGKS